MDDSERVDSVAGRVFKPDVETRPGGVKPPRNVLARSLWESTATTKTTWADLPEFMQDVYLGHADRLLADEKVWGETR